MHPTRGRRRRRGTGIALVAIAIAALLVASCAAGDGTASPPSTGSLAGSATGSTVGSSGGPTGSGPDGRAPSGTTPPAGEAEPWSDDPAVEPVGETIDGSMVTPDGRTRTWHLYVPTTLAPDEPVPLLVGLHGGTGWGEQFQRSSRFDGIAEANGFLVVFPDGIGVGPTESTRTWNGGECCGPAARDDVDDVGFISRLIDELTSTYDIDPSRIYAAGHSNGAVMSIRLACELSAQIVAVGFQAGTLSTDTCDPAVPVSMLHIHGEADENLPPQGGKGTKGISGVDWNPALDGLRTIAAAESCPDPTSVTDPAQPDLKIQRWSPCRDDTTIEYVLVPGANHAWMGASGGVSPSGTPFAGFDSSAAIWTFLAAHPRG